MFESHSEGEQDESENQKSQVIAKFYKHSANSVLALWTSRPFYKQVNGDQRNKI